MKFVVARLDEFATGDRRIVRVGGREIGVFRVGVDEFYAIRNRCPHQGGPLCAGWISPRLVSEMPGQYQLDEGAPVLVCPWHGWQYDMATGQSFVPGDPDARSYRVSVERGVVVAAELECGAALLEGPYVAETFPVHVDDDYVILDA